MNIKETLSNLFLYTKIQNIKKIKQQKYDIKINKK